MGNEAKRNGGWSVVKVLVGVILSILLAFSGWSANSIAKNGQTIMDHQLKPSHVGMDARVKAIEDDVGEIKDDVKELLRR